MYAHSPNLTAPSLTCYVQETPMEPSRGPATAILKLMPVLFAKRLLFQRANAGCACGRQAKGQQDTDHCCSESSSSSPTARETSVYHASMLTMGEAQACNTERARWHTRRGRQLHDVTTTLAARAFPIGRGVRYGPGSRQPEARRRQGSAIGLGALLFQAHHSPCPYVTAENGLYIYQLS